jgi:23S rRNA (uracil1939-C5)-methyltransferase
MPERRLCAHFGVCGGCVSQNVPDTDYRAAKRALVAEALAAAGLDGAVVDEVASVAQVTRRRAVFKLAKQDGVTCIGFHAARSHSIVDMRECLVLRPSIFKLAQELRVLLGAILAEQESAELHVTEADNGLDLAIAWKRRVSPALTALFARAAPGLIRVTAKDETILEREAPFVRLGKAQVKIPPRAFLQASRDGEAALQARAVAALAGAKSIADLFAGLGTFSFALAEKARVHAVEQEAPALAALAAAARATSGLKPVTSEKRDLFKRPLTATELNRHDAVLLDPPRAGAQAQIREIAASKLRRVVYVSCDARSFARDARTLADAGFRPGPVTPIDQFLWSSHIELVGLFSRG